MATTLQSPGVSVSIINESFYTPAAPGTVPLIFIASRSNKTNPSGVTAPGTKPANAGKVYTITSQRDLTDKFGVPQFVTDSNGNPVHGSELNEYGLQAAYSFLGVSSQAYIARAPIDLGSLVPQTDAPSGAPADGAYWLDTSNTQYGIFEWSQAAGTFTHKTPLIINDTNSALDTVDSEGIVPNPSFGLVGQYVVVSTNLNSNAVWYKNSNANWVQVGTVGETNFENNSASNTFESTVWATSFPTVTGSASPASITQTGSLKINGHTITVSAGVVADIATSINNALHVYGVGAKVVGGALAIYADATATDGSINVDSTSTAAVLTELGIASGTYAGPTVFVGPHTQYPNFSTKPSGSVYMKTTSPNSGANWFVKKYSATSATFSRITASVYADGATATYNLDKTGGGANIAVGTLFVESNYEHGDNTAGPILANFKIQQRVAVSPTKITSIAHTSTVSISTGTLTVNVSQPGTTSYTSTAPLSISGSLSNLVQAINNSGVANLSASNNNDGSVSIVHATGGEIKFIDDDSVLAQAGFTAGTTANFYELGMFETDSAQYKASNWKPLTFTASSSTPSSTPVTGQLWYSGTNDQIDLLVNDGEKWVGYENYFPGTDPRGPNTAYTAPTTQQDGTTPLVNGDVWVSLAGGIDTYGQDIYVWNGTTLKWDLQNPADSTSPSGWLFRDARWATSGQAVEASSIADLRLSDYVDPDCPDPAEYPRGVTLWNLRRSGFNVKEYRVGYIDINDNDGFNIRVPSDPMNGSNSTVKYNADRWVTVSPNAADGSGSFGRHAQRSFVVASFKSLIDSNQTIRDTDTLVFNLIACPGYVEATQNLIGLNADRGQTAFIVGDTPFRLPADATSLQAWGLNSNGALDNGDVGAVSYSEYMAMFYPSGYTNDLSGNYIVVPPSHMMLRTIALSDQQSYPWFAPAGIRRGVVDNATSVGYVDSATGEFQRAALPQGVRDVMYASAKINPIATLTGAGIVNFGQKTRANTSSALDRINVARLVCYVRRQLDLLSRPYLFEPNDKITQNEIKNAMSSFFLELVGQRALYDFIVVCDSSNNTPDRVDRNELWVDVAIEPVKAVEFIYIPVRLVNTGAIQAGTFSLA